MVRKHLKFRKVDKLQKAAILSDIFNNSGKWLKIKKFHRSAAEFKKRDMG